MHDELHTLTFLLLLLVFYLLCRIHERTKKSSVGLQKAQRFMICGSSVRCMLHLIWVRKLTGNSVARTIADCEAEARRIQLPIMRRFYRSAPPELRGRTDALCIILPGHRAWFIISGAGNSCAGVNPRHGDIIRNIYTD